MCFGRKGASGFSASATAEKVTEGVDGTGLTAIITGASSGIGTETTRVLALRGVHVIMAVRNTASGRDVKDEILKKIPKARIDVMELDLSSLASVRKFASDFISQGLPLNILINNAGIMATPFTLTKDNVELQFATNHLGHFLLCNLLLDTMKKTAQESGREGRIVIVASEAYKVTYAEGIRLDKINDKSGYSSAAAYGQSKLANILHAIEFSRRLKEEGANVTVNSLHPGVIATNIFRHHTILGGCINFFGKLFMKNIPQGAATTCYVALNPKVEGKSGHYFVDCNIADPKAKVIDPELAKKLWDVSLDLVNKSSYTS